MGQHYPEQHCTAVTVKIVITHHQHYCTHPDWCFVLYVCTIIWFAKPVIIVSFRALHIGVYCRRIIVWSPDREFTNKKNPFSKTDYSFLLCDYFCTASPLHLFLISSHFATTIYFRNKQNISLELLFGILCFVVKSLG